jgi:cytochrome bd ubiquinol oxidase subunit II
VVLVIGGCQHLDAAGPPDIASRWFTLPNLFWFLPVPILVLVTMYAWCAPWKKCPLRAVPVDPGADVPGLQRLGISLWPNIIPPSISIWEAAAPPQSQGFYAGRQRLFIIPFIWVTPSGATTCSAAR